VGLPEALVQAVLVVRVVRAQGLLAVLVAALVVRLRIPGLT
jgi:hypothetical protein